MCRRVECRSCGRPTYAGCGAHVEEVLRNVPLAERCRCREERSADGGQRRAPRSWLEWLLGK